MKNTVKFALMLGMAAAALAAPAFAGSGGWTPRSVPEPSTLAMLASGLGGVIALRHWRKR
jgi:hypothetical protein